MKRTLMILAGILAAQSAAAFTLEYDTTNHRNFLGWTTNTLTFDYDLSACGVPNSVVLDSIQAAMDIWNSVPTSALTLQLGTTTTMTWAQRNTIPSGANPIIFCDPNFSADLGADGNVIPGVAVALKADADWHLSAAVFILNSESGKNDNIANAGAQAILSSIAAHEIGHVFGLGHSADVNALMYYNASAKTTLGLSQDDYDGITYLYPRNEPSTGRMFGCATVQAIGAGAASSRFRGPGGGSEGGNPPNAAPAAEFAGILMACGLLTLGLRKGLFSAKIA